MENEISNNVSQMKNSGMESLNDWTITDIATTPKTAPEDRMNAEIEIMHRQEANNYNLDAASHDVKADMEDNGYGIKDGKILYPKEEYQEWPSTTKQETAIERLESLKRKQDAIDEQKRLFLC